MTEQQNPPNEPGQPQDRAGDDSKLETAKHAEFPLERELQAGDDAAKREADERRARLAGKGGPVGGSSGGGSGGSSGGWERDVLEKVLMASLREQRSARRWKIFFRFLTLAIIALILYAVIDFKGDVLSSTSGRHTAMVTLDGEIAAGTTASADSINAALQAAFEDTSAAGVILKINSRDSPPAQAVSGQAVLRGGRGNLRIGRLLRGRRSRQDLCRQGQYRRVDRRADGWLWLYGPDGQGRRPAPPVHVRRQ